MPLIFAAACHSISVPIAPKHEDEIDSIGV